MFLHSGRTSNPLIRLDVYPVAADDASINTIPRFSFRNPLSLTQFLCVLLERRLYTSVGEPVSVFEPMVYRYAMR